jgi:hypothetical protein
MRIVNCNVKSCKSTENENPLFLRIKPHIFPHYIRLTLFALCQGGGHGEIGYHLAKQLKAKVSSGKQYVN